VNRSAFRFTSRLSVPCLLLLPLLASAQSPTIDPAGLPGPLVIVGEGKLSKDARDAFFSLAGKDKAKIVVIPTASKDADDAKKLDAFQEQWKELKPASVEVLHTLDKKQADDPKFVKPLTEATGVWFVDGNPERLNKAYRGTLVEKELQALHTRGGVIGGAGVMGDLTVDVGSRIGVTRGLELLSGFILAEHSGPRDPRGGRIGDRISEHPGYAGLAFAPDSALVIRGRNARVIGDGTVTVHIGKGAGKVAAADEYKAGSLIDIVQLRREAANRAAKVPFPPEKPPVPEVAKGMLMIIGGGGSSPEMWERFIKASGGPDALIVVIPTALEDSDIAKGDIGETKILKKNGAKNVEQLHTRDPKQADDPKFSEVLTKAGGVWFSGGRQWKFVDAYAGTLTEKRFHEVLDRGGAIGGSSAGASIQSEYMPRGHPLGNTVMAAEGYEKGFGFLPGCAVDQHFFVRKRTGDMSGLMKKYPQYLGIGLDEATAIVVTGHTAEVIGKTKVAFFDTNSPGLLTAYEVLKPGEKYDLKERKKLGN
jgi:cyanophycinase